MRDGFANGNWIDLCELGVLVLQWGHCENEEQGSRKWRFARVMSRPEMEQDHIVSWADIASDTFLSATTTVWSPKRSHEEDMLYTTRRIRCKNKAIYDVLYLPNQHI